MMQKQIEMFAGVAVFNMPTVHQFFIRQIILPMSWISKMKFNFTHLLSSSAREKFSDHNPSVPGWDRNNTHTSEDRERFKMRNLNPNGYERKAAETPRVGDSQIRLTQEISIV